MKMIMMMVGKKDFERGFCQTYILSRCRYVSYADTISPTKVSTFERAIIAISLEKYYSEDVNKELRS